MDDSGVMPYHEWIISAIKSSKVDGELHEKKLLDNCVNCCNQVKSLLASNKDSQIKYEEFRLNTTILLLLGCADVSLNHEVSASEELIPLVKSIPSIKVENFLLVMKGLKNNKYLRGVLPWLPATVLISLSSQFLNQLRSVTPMSLAINFELFFGILYSIQYEEKENDGIKTFIESYSYYLNSNQTEYDSTKNDKMLAYHFMYIIESIYLMESILFKEVIEDPYTYSLGLKFKKLKENVDIKLCSHYDSLLRRCLLCFSATLSRMVLDITSNIWISWHDVRAPPFGVCIPTTSETGESIPEKSIQLVISHSVYRIMKFYSRFNDVLNLEVNRELYSFFSHIAVDPNYDSDEDLSNLELIEAIKTASKTKKEKLLSLLLKREDIFKSEDCLECAVSSQHCFPVESIIPLTKSLIKNICYNNEIHRTNEWKKIVLQLLETVTNEEIINIITEHLDYGRNNCMKTLNFELDFTDMFNRLSELKNIMHYNDYLHLCLQSGVEVVQKSIDMALNMPGLISITASALISIAFICRAKKGNEFSLLTKILSNKVSQLGFTIDISQLVIALLNKQKLYCSSLPSADDLSSTLLPVDVQEMFGEFLCPKFECYKSKVPNLQIILEVLEVFIELYPEDILRAKARLVSIIVCLIMVHNNSAFACSRNVVRFGCQTSKGRAKLRRVIERIMSKLTEAMVDQAKSFAKEIILMEDCLSKYDLHPRSLSLICCLTKIVSPDDIDIVDQIFDLIIKRNLKPEAIKDLACSRKEWVWALYIIITSCDEGDWKMSFLVTRMYLNTHVGDTNMITPTLKIFEEVLLLLCDNNVPCEYDPIGFYFENFASAAMSFVEAKVHLEGLNVFMIVGMFNWWCKIQRVFKCDPEYPCFFLYDLINFMINQIDKKRNRKYRLKSIEPKDKYVFESISSDEEDEDETSAHEESDLTVNDEFPEKIKYTKEEFKIHHSSVKNVHSSILNGTANLTSDEYKMAFNSAMANEKLKSKPLTKDDLLTAVDDMITTFTMCIKPNHVASVIVGKFKILIELVRKYKS